MVTVEQSILADDMVTVRANGHVFHFTKRVLLLLIELKRKERERRLVRQEK